MRFWNNDVLTNIEGVIEKIKETLGRKDTLTLTSSEEKTPHPNPLPSRARERKRSEGLLFLSFLKSSIEVKGFTEGGFFSLSNLLFFIFFVF